jgi:hypothetical protein
LGINEPDPSNWNWRRLANNSHRIVCRVSRWFTFTCNTTYQVFHFVVTWGASFGAKSRGSQIRMAKLQTWRDEIKKIV